MSDGENVADGQVLVVDLLQEGVFPAVQVVTDQAIASSATQQEDGVVYLHHVLYLVSEFGTFMERDRPQGGDLRLVTYDVKRELIETVGSGGEPQRTVVQLNDTMDICDGRTPVGLLGLVDPLRFAGEIAKTGILCANPDKGMEATLLEAIDPIVCQAVGCGVMRDR